MANSVRRLPGIQIDVAPPPAVQALPRLDVAVFVGFASTGPLHLPVAIESTAQYAWVFGPDAPLAWDAQRGERVLSHLGPAVRSFFANGGLRCWVVRVARTTALEKAAGRNVGSGAVLATTSRFALPGVLTLPGQGCDSPTLAASVAARCEGSWADGMRVETALQQRSVALSGWSALDSPPSQRFAFKTRDTLRIGELLQLGDDASTCAYAIVEKVAAGPKAGDPYEVELVVCAAFERLAEPSLPALDLGWSVVDGFTEVVAAHWVQKSALRHSERDPKQTLQFDEVVSARLEPGHWVRWECGMQVAWLHIDGIDRQAAFSGSPPALDSSMMEASVSGPAWRELDRALPAALGMPLRAQVLELELRTTDPCGLVHRLAHLALTPQRLGNFWEQQPDADFYRRHDEANAVAPSEQQRFPLAPEAGAAPLAWLPLGVKPSFGIGLAPLPHMGTALERDGLANFNSELFIDPALATDSMDAVLAHADAIRLINPPTRGLFGMHAALGLGVGGLFDEPSLLSLPDAIHLGWRPRVGGEVTSTRSESGATPAHWVAHRGPCRPDEKNLPALVSPDFGVFIDCATRKLDALVLSGPHAQVPPGTYRLAWTDCEPGAQYTLWEATSADFKDEQPVFSGSATQYVALTQREGTYHYRVFAHSGDERSGASNTVSVRVRSEDWVQCDSDFAELALEPQWLAVHRAALRLAAASGNWLAVLCMPRHFRTAQALRYTQRLRRVQEPRAQFDAQALAASEERALSYGAIYFPWLQSDARDAGRAGNRAAAIFAPRVVPPDGVAVGVLAARSAHRGPWVAAANEPMKDVVALTPPVPERDRQALQDAQINLLRDDPRGFFTLSADTLAASDDLRPINVRRLLILLRRLALRRGASYVFEPNGPTLRRAVERGFNLLLTDLFDRGAFAGATAAQSFRVVTDDTINTPQGMEAGRFFVELRVAPSLPLRFMAVRLAQRGERLSLVEEL